jgi:hypothetical protein
VFERGAQVGDRDAGSNGKRAARGVVGAGKMGAARPGLPDCHIADRFMIKVTPGTSTLSTLRKATGLIPMDKLAARK